LILVGSSFRALPPLVEAAVGLSAHTPLALGAWPVSAAIPNAVDATNKLTHLTNY